VRVAGSYYCGPLTRYWSGSGCPSSCLLAELFPFVVCVGVWSGCAFPTDEGTVLLHTAVRQRSKTPESELPPRSLDLGNEVIESQQFAIAQPRKAPAGSLF
jgi:hypothetical protein